MKLLEDAIKKYGVVKKGEILKVDSFLNHQIDTKLLDAMADEFVRLFKDKKVTKVFTIETSGIAIAYPLAFKLNVPLVFAKKTESVNLDGDLYSSKVISYTHFREYDVIVSKKFLTKKDHVVIVDDFLSNGCALHGLLSICNQAEAKVEGIGIAIEKTFKKGGREIRDLGFEIKSLAKIKSFDEKNNSVVFEN